MKRTVQSFFIRLALFLPLINWLQISHAVDASYDHSSKILDIPALQINSNLRHVVLQLDNDGCFQLLSSSPATEAFSGAVYDPITTTATFQSVKNGNTNYQATIQYLNGCFSITSAAVIPSQGGIKIGGST